MSGDAPSWIDIVGFQREPVHTGVLKWLLESPDHRRSIGEALGLNDPDARPSVKREHPAPGRKRPADLVACVGDDPRETLVVEVKVDSPLRDGQLAALTSSDGSIRSAHVLLAVGAEGMRLFGDACEKLDLADSQWRVIDAKAWLDVLDLLDDLPDRVREYREAIRGEVELHDDARRAVGSSARPPADIPDRKALVYAWAWLSEAAKAVGGGPPRRCEPRIEPRTGPKLYVWHLWDSLRAQWPNAADRHNFGLWLELRAGRDGRLREAAIKAGAWDADARAALVEAARERFEPHITGWEPIRRTGSATLWTRDVEDLSAQHVGAACDDIVKLARTHGEGLLEAAFEATNRR